MKLTNFVFIFFLALGAYGASGCGSEDVTSDDSKSSSPLDLQSGETGTGGRDGTTTATKEPVAPTTNKFPAVKFTN